ncbi:hypothetical protein P879_05069 [Paragonimus westermani]|uniref:Uncharacterized protein n=1 Tax=Paragonimus westermani TaxID=34504 RepID=A0A8T0DYP1_9TREM|nr:hypothetical protein P879_05069 [Paragonimus westermani]
MYDNGECPFDYKSSENSENINYSPTALSWLPKNLLNSPTVQKYPAAVTDLLINDELTEPACTPSEALFTGSNLNIRGMKLTTQSGAHIIILDPYVAEQLVLNPIRAQLIACARSWTREVQDQLSLSKLIQARNSLSCVYEEYLDVFGQLPGPISKGKSYYLDYALNDVDDETEKQNLLETFQLAQRYMTEQLQQEPTSAPRIRNSTNSSMHLWERPDDSTTPNYPPTNGNTTFDERVVNTLDDKLKGKKRSPLQPVTLVNSSKPQKSCRPMKTEDMLFNVRYKTQPCRHYEQSGRTTPLNYVRVFSAPAPPDERDFHPRLNRLKLLESTFE